MTELYTNAGIPPIFLRAWEEMEEGKKKLLSEIFTEYQDKPFPENHYLEPMNWIIDFMIKNKITEQGSEDIFKLRPELKGVLFKRVRLRIVKIIRDYDEKTKNKKSFIDFMALYGKKVNTYNMTSLDSGARNKDTVRSNANSFKHQLKLDFLSSKYQLKLDFLKSKHQLKLDFLKGKWGGETQGWHFEQYFKMLSKRKKAET
jgi:hypothetical protein